MIKKLIYGFLLFAIIPLFIFSRYFSNLWPLLYERRYEFVFLFGIREKFGFINVLIDNILVLFGGGLKYLCVYNFDLIAVYFCIVILYIFLFKHLKLQLNYKQSILFNSVFILIYITYIALTRYWTLINILLLVLCLFTHWSVWLPRLIAKKNNAKTAIWQSIIFCFISILLIVLTGNNSEKAVLIKSCGYYDVNFSHNFKKVFLIKNKGDYPICKNESEALEIMNSSDFTYEKIIYGSNFGIFLSIDEERGNLYFTDRGNKKLVIMDINDYSIKGEIYHPMIDEGDNYIEYDKNHIYLLAEDYLKISKIDANTMKKVKTRVIDHDVEGTFLTFNKNNSLLYAMNHIDRKNNKFFIWIINPVTLETVKKVPINGFITRMIFLKKKEEMYHTMLNGSFLTSYVSVRDAKSLKIKDNIIVSFGLRDIAIDEERGLLFAGNALTGVVEIIDLSNKKIIKLIKTSNSMLRRLALDTINQYVYITTWNGIYRYAY